MGIPSLKTKNQNKFKPILYTSKNKGEKIIIYGAPGIGKTTLAALAPKPVFIDVEGGLGISNKLLMYIPNIKTFADVREALSQPNLFKDYESIVIDTITELERLALPYLFRTVPKNQSGQVIRHIEDYGYHKGYRRWHDVMRLILSDCDQLIMQGKNIIMIAQSTICKYVQAGAEDFVKEGCELYHDKNVSTLNTYIAWANHVFRIANCDITIKKGKASGTTERAVYVHPLPHFHAKSRTISAKNDVISFENPQDSSIWRLLFGEK